MQRKVERFEDLEVWKRSARLASEIYKYFNTSKNFAFVHQITRSAISISSNIAEGFERLSKKEMLQFLSYARGSCGELRSQIYIGIDIGSIDKKLGLNWIKEAIEISSMLSGLIKSVKKFLSKEL